MVGSPGSRHLGQAPMRPTARMCGPVGAGTVVSSYFRDFGGPSTNFFFGAVSCHVMSQRPLIRRGKCLDMSSTPVSPEIRQMSKKMSRHLCLGQTSPARGLARGRDDGDSHHLMTLDSESSLFERVRLMIPSLSESQIHNSCNALRFTISTENHNI